MSSKKQIYITVAVGMLLLVIGTIFSSTLILFLAHLTVIYSSGSLAKIKGYGIVGIVLGLFFNIVGFLVVVVLPNKQKQSNKITN